LCQWPERLEAPSDAEVDGQRSVREEPIAGSCVERERGDRG
jgi:hypothetical protein